MHERREVPRTTRRRGKPLSPSSGPFSAQDRGLHARPFLSRQSINPSIYPSFHVPAVLEGQAPSRWDAVEQPVRVCVRRSGKDLSIHAKQPSLHTHTHTHTDTHRHIHTHTHIDTHRQTHTASTAVALAPMGEREPSSTHTHTHTAHSTHSTHTQILSTLPYSAHRATPLPPRPGHSR